MFFFHTVFVEVLNNQASTAHAVVIQGGEPKPSKLPI